MTKYNQNELFREFVASRLKPERRGAQADLARYLGVLPQTIYKFLRQGRDGGEDERRKIAEFYNVSYEYALCAGEAIKEGRPIPDPTAPETITISLAEYEEMKAAILQSEGAMADVPDLTEVVALLKEIKNVTHDQTKASGDQIVDAIKQINDKAYERIIAERDEAHRREIADKDKTIIKLEEDNDRLKKIVEANKPIPFVPPEGGDATGGPGNGNGNGNGGSHGGDKKVSRPGVAA